MYYIMYEWGAQRAAHAFICRWFSASLLLKLLLRASSPQSDAPLAMAVFSRLL